MSEVGAKIEDLRFVGQIISPKDQSQEFEVLRGITDPLYKQYKNYLAHDSSLSDFTNDTERFAQTVYEFADRRAVYSLVGSRLICGIIWFGQKAGVPPDAPIDFAVRTCGIGRGNGLALPFMQTSIADFVRTSQTVVESINLEVKTANIGAIALYEAFGFRSTDIQDKPETLKMTYNPVFAV